MSKSYKHEPTAGGKNKFCKKQANRRVRRNKMELETSKGGYKKIYCSWEICDYFSRCTWEEYYPGDWEKELIPFESYYEFTDQIKPSIVFAIYVEYDYNGEHIHKYLYGGKTNA